MVHSLYSDKDIFLRELISNASDALDKLRFEQLTAGHTTGELNIRLEADPAARTLVIADNGIGMTRDEVVRNIGTIARSGTKEFLAAVKAAQRQDLPPELIGQFGVGFYSAFMVADKVELVTRRAGTDTATRWESTGDGAYTIADGERAEPGTTVTLHLRAADPEHGLRDYTTDQVLKEIVKKYSDFVAYPIRLKSGLARDGGLEPSQGSGIEDETLNSMKAIWDRPKAEVSEQEYNELYKHLSHDFADPLRTIVVRIEGTFEAYAVLYIPSRPPFDLYSAEMKRGLNLYVKRVFIMDECRELLPPNLRFIRGVVDAHDLSLNVSREILQKDRQVAIIRKNLVKKIFGTLEEMKRDSFADYGKFWSAFGPVLKEGLLLPEVDDKLLDLVLTTSTTQSEPTAFADYLGRMKEGQDAIYVLSGPSKDAVARSPLLEAFAQKGYEVLLFSDPVDELWLDRPLKYKDKPIRAIGRGEVQLGSEEERKQAADALADKQREVGDLIGCLRAALQDSIKEVRLSSRLTSSAVCLVSDENDLSPRVQRMLESLGQKPPKARPILELNPNHPVVARLQKIFAESPTDPRLKLYAELLLGQAHLADSGHLPDPAAFSRVLGDVLLQ
jgi:molecular chaperone HtpG